MNTSLREQNQQKEALSNVFVSWQNVSHTYTDYRFYGVTLTITTDVGTHSLTLDDVIYVKSPPDLPTKEVCKEGEECAYHSIQEAIDDAGDWETILVHNGIYSENINLKGKSITVYSENGATSAIIEGSLNRSVVTFL